VKENTAKIIIKTTLKGDCIN